jgi:hypothetical protein
MAAIAALALALAGCSPPAATEKAAPAKPQAEPSSTALFNGKDLAGWKVLADDWFDKHGKVYVKDGAIHLDEGDAQTGIVWTRDFPKSNYEVTLEAMRVTGSDFFSGLTFPIGKDGFATWIVGGWGGGLIGLSNVDGANASENQTSTSMSFESNQWYTLRLVVTDERIECWIDQVKRIELERGEHKFAVWANQEPARPFGIVTWHTGGALRNIKLRRLNVNG